MGPSPQAVSPSCHHEGWAGADEMSNLRLTSQLTDETPRDLSGPSTCYRGTSSPSLGFGWWALREGILGVLRWWVGDAFHLSDARKAHRIPAPSGLSG